MKMLNILPIFHNHADFAISEIKRQHQTIGLVNFAVSLSFHPQGTPAVAAIAPRCAEFIAIRDALKDWDINLGILIQSTQGHGWNGKVALTNEPWQHVVNIDNNESPRMCALDSNFQDYLMQVTRECVKTGAKFLLVDDDFGIRRDECFCPLHISAYNKALGKNYSQQEIIDIIRLRDADDPESVIIAQTRLSGIVPLAKAIRGVIDEINPSIRCGYCNPYTGFGFCSDVAHALAGATKPFIRVNNAVYGQKNPVCLHRTLRDTLLIKHQYDGIDEVIDESDTFPQSYWSESAAVFHSHITLAAINGLTGCKLWTSNFSRPEQTNSQKKYEARLRDYRGFYSAAKKAVEGIEWRGVTGALYHPRHPMHPLLCNKEIFCDDWLSTILGTFAIPLNYATVDQKNAVFALTENESRHLTDNELERLLAKAVLLDSTAAKDLAKRGFATLTGVDADDGDDDFYFSSEQHTEKYLPISHQWDPSAAHLSPVSDDVRVVMNFCKGPARFENPVPCSPSMTFFENRLGGRVAVTGWTPHMPYYKTLRPERREAVLEALDFLAGGILEMTIESYETMLVRHGVMRDGSELLAIFNLSMDVVSPIPIRTGRTPKRVQKLTPDGTWKDVEFTRGSDQIVEIHEPSVCCEPVLLRLSLGH